MPLIKLSSILAVFLAVQFAWPDTVHLKNGDTISGTITGFDDGKITVDTEYAGSLSIDPIHVRWLETAGELMVLHPEQPPRTLTGDESKDLDLSAMEYIGPPLPQDPTREVDWEGNLDAQLAIRVGETDTYDAIAGVAVTRHKRQRVLNTLSPISRLRLSLSSAYGESEGELETHRVAVGERYRKYWDNSLYLLQLSGITHDAGRDLDLRATAGLGIGYEVIAAERRSLSVDAALTYDYERWEDDTSSGDVREENHVNLLLGLDFEQRFGNGAALTDSLEVTPRLDQPGELRLTNTLAYTAPVTTNTFIRFEWRAEYESDPPSDVEEWDHLFTSGIRYKF